MSNTVTQQQIDDLIKNAEVRTYTAFDKCTVVLVQLKNGFILTESSACVDPMNYDEDMGYEICMERIKNKLWELEGYVLQKTFK
jgi:hypothetical protein